MDNGSAPHFDEWAIVELMGHRKLAGRVSEAPLGRGELFRLDVPDGLMSDRFVTQFYGWSSVYCMTVTDELAARKFAVMHQPTPVHRWELPPASPEEDEDRHFDVLHDDDQGEPL